MEPQAGLEDLKQVLIKLGLLNQIIQQALKSTTFTKQIAQQTYV